MLSQFSDEDPCAGLDFQKATCETKLEKCFEKKFSAEMKDFFVERAIQFKQWMIFAKKLLDIHHAKESLDNILKFVVLLFNLKVFRSRKLKQISRLL